MWASGVEGSEARETQDIKKQFVDLGSRKNRNERLPNDVIEKRKEGEN